jgi:Fe-S cluster assembly protein SufD
MHTSTRTQIQPAQVDQEDMVDRIAQANLNPEWLKLQRRQAWKAFTSAPLPSRVTHLWRYTDPQLFSRPGESPAAIAAAHTPTQWPEFIAENLRTESLAGAAYNIDGSAVHAALDPDLAAVGVQLMSLHLAARMMPEIVRKYLGTLIGPEFGKFEAEVNALWTSGLLLYVPRGLRVEKPFHLLTAAPDEGQMRLQRLLVVVDDHASATVIDEYGIGNGAGRASMVVEQFVGNGSRLKYIPVQNWGKDTVSYTTQRAHLGADAYGETVLLSIGAGAGKIDCGAYLAGRGANNILYGLAIGGGKQHYDHHTVHDHQAPNTFSDLHFKVALKERAESVYTGLIRIDQHAPNCEAYQENRNLLLSPGARAESIPELEILNKEVRCTHGATVGQIEQEEVFYLESRGIEREEAVRLIVGGFVAPIIDRVPDVSQERLRETVMRNLRGA